MWGGRIGSSIAGLLALLFTAPAFAKCEQIRVSALHMRIIGPAGGTCTLMMPLRITGMMGQPLEFREARVVSPPEFGSVSIRPNRRANLLEVTYRAGIREPVRDRFVYEECVSGELRQPCRNVRVDVGFSPEAARRAQTFCRPKPFALRTDRPVTVSMTGAVGDRCAIRLYRSEVAMRVTIEEQPSNGRAWVETSTIFYVGREIGSDQFKARACKWDDPNSCSVLHVSVQQR